MRAAAMQPLPEDRVHCQTKSGERVIHDCQRMWALAIADFGDAEHAAKFACFYFDRTGLGRRAGRGLRERRGHGRVEGGVPLSFLQHLVDVPIKHGERAKAFRVAERARTVFRAPTPLRISHPERHVREDDDGSAVGNGFEIIHHPFELHITKLTESAFAYVQYIVQTDEVRAFVVETEPAAAFRSFAEALEVLFAVVIEDVVLTRYVEHLLGLAALEDLFKCVELFGLGKVRQVAGVNNKVRRRGQGVDLRDCFLQRAEHVLVRFLAEADVAVADLHEREVSGNRGFGLGSDGIGRPQNAGSERAACAGPEHSGAGPGHTFEETAAINAVWVVIVFYYV